MAAVKGLIHKFLTYAPISIVGVVIAAAGVWEGLATR